MNQITFIYALRCPATGDVRYVGRSTNPIRRYYQHVNHRRGCNAQKAAWMKALDQHGMRPDLILLDYCKTSEYKRVEGGWIQYFLNLGCDLVNGVYKGCDKQYVNQVARMANRDDLEQVEMARIEAS